MALPIKSIQSMSSSIQNKLISKKTSNMQMFFTVIFITFCFTSLIILYGNLSTLDSEYEENKLIKPLLKKTYQPLEMEVSRDLHCIRYLHTPPQNECPKEDDISLVTHVSLNKLSRVVELMKSWKGHVSLSIFSPSYATGIQGQLEFMNQHPELASRMAIHLVFSKKTYTDAYPINIMRNAAKNGILTNYILAVDVDFIPNPTSYDEIQTLLIQEKHQLKNKTVFILPAFERFNKNNELHQEIQLPTTKQELLHSIRTERIIFPFHVDIFPPGHGPTNFVKWYNATEPYSIAWEPRFEPYFVAYSPGLPSYWDGFRGYGYNKLSWIMEIYIQGYQFQVLDHSFLIHINHPEKYGRISSSSTWDEYLLHFKPYLKKRYNLTQVEDVDYM